MIFRLSGKFLLRSKRKTLLLCALVMLINIFSILGISMYDNSVKMLKDADEAFTTLGVLEYTGGNYPDNTKMDADSIEQLSAFSYEVITSREEFLAWHRQYLLLGHVDGVQLGEFFDVPFLNYSVIRFKVMYIMEDGMYRCVLTDNLYSLNAKEGSTFGLSNETLSNIDKYQLENDHYYIACGDFRKEGGLLVFSPIENTGLAEDIDPSKNIADFPFRDVTDSPDYITSSPEMKYWNALIDFYRVQNGSFQVMATDCMETQTDFYLGTADVAEGRTWTEKEEEEGKKVCVIHTGIASVLDKKVGDTITLDIHYSEDMKRFYSSYSSSTGFSETQEYEIIGIYNEGVSSGNQYIFVPDSSLTSLPADQVLYQMGNVELKNGTAESFEAATQGLFENKFRMNTYDQGYMQTAAPIKAMQRNSIIIMTLCGICDMVVIFLFATLHVVKQFDVVSILTSMGTGKKKIMQFLLYGTATIGGVGNILGGMIGYLVSSSVIRFAYIAAVNTHTKDLRFSNLSMGIQKNFEANIQGSVFVAFAVSLVILGAMLVLCCLYGRKVIVKAQNFGGQQGKKKRKKEAEKIVTAAAVPKESFTYRTIAPEEKKYFSLGRMKFVIKQSLRGGRRNLRVNVLLFLIPMAIAIFMMVFTHTLEMYKLSLQETYQKFPVDAYLTTFTGKPVNLYDVPEDIYQYIKESPNVSRVYESSDICFYEPIGKLIGEAGSEEYEECLAELNMKADELFKEPGTSFALETRVAQIKNDSFIVSADDMARSLEFFGTTPPAVNFLPGMKGLFTMEDADFLQESVEVDWSDPVLMGVATDELMKMYNLELGDYLYIGAISLDYNSAGDVVGFITTRVKIQIVGNYKTLSSNNNLYIPQTENLTYNNYMNFRLRNAWDLSEFRDDLEELGVTSVGYAGQTRVSMIIKDKELVQSIDSIQNNISFMTSLGYVLFGVVIIIGFIASFLSMRTRREEVAIIRSMGAGKVRTFTMFFLEQFIIGILGTFAGMAAAYIYTGEIALMEIGMVLIFFLCFMLGSGLCIARMNRKNVLSILSATD